MSNNSNECSSPLQPPSCHGFSPCWSSLSSPISYATHMHLSKVPSSATSSYVCSSLPLTVLTNLMLLSARRRACFLCIKAHWDLSERVSWWESKQNRLLLSYKADWCYVQMKEKLQHLRRLNKRKLENWDQQITGKYYPVNSFVCSMFITVSAMNIHLLSEICFHYMSPCECVCLGEGWPEISKESINPLGLVVQLIWAKVPGTTHTRMYS